jgi:predicted Zn-dependent protease
MYRAGYEPLGMATMLQTLLGTRKQRPSAVGQFFSSHPLTEDRISAVRSQIATLPPRSGLIASDRTLPSIKQRVKRYAG